MLKEAAVVMRSSRHGIHAVGLSWVERFEGPGLRNDRFDLLVFGIVGRHQADETDEQKRTQNFQHLKRINSNFYKSIKLSERKFPP